MCNFNLFRNLVLSEDGHSSLLRKIIHPRGSHGNGTLFLKIFFEEVLQRPFNDSFGWEVVNNVRTGKKSYVDIVIYNSNTTEIYVIENKVKGAKDQPNQLYRYWYGLKYGSEYRTDSIGHREATKIYYLTYNNGKPSKKSLTRPSNGTKFQCSAFTDTPKLLYFRLPSLQTQIIRGCSPLLSVFDL